MTKVQIFYLEQAINVIYSTTNFYESLFSLETMMHNIEQILRTCLHLFVPLPLHEILYCRG